MIVGLVAGVGAVGRLQPEVGVVGRLQLGARVVAGRAQAVGAVGRSQLGVAGVGRLQVAGVVGVADRVHGLRFGIG